MLVGARRAGRTEHHQRGGQLFAAAGRQGRAVIELPFGRGSYL
jgi:hypothetical protein